MDDDDFFGFNTSLPPVKRGPQQEFGDVELEDTYDALNDVTFGVINHDDDWEEEHEKLTEYMEDFPRQEKVSAQDSHKELENSSYSEHQLFNLRNLHINNKIVDIEGENSEDAANVAASVSQILLEDDEIDSIISKPIHLTRSMESKLFGRMSPQSSLFVSDIVGSPSTSSIWSTQPSDMQNSSEKPKGNSSFSVINGSQLPVSDRNSTQEQLYKTVEELERHLLTQPNRLTMEELERKLLNNRSVAPHLVRSVEEIEAEFARSQKSQHIEMIPRTPPLPPHLLSFLRLPPPMGLSVPPPSGISIPHHIQPLPFQGIRIETPLLLPPRSTQTARTSQSGSKVSNESKIHPTAGYRNASANSTYDDYVGLMSTKEKQWLMSIQINQLISDNPYVEDYYFTVLRLRCLGKLNPERSTREGPKLIIPGRTKPESKMYAPTQFANSLGKLQVVTYTAPRRIIDVNISQATSEFPHDQLAVKDMRKFKQILLDIEKMYIWLLDFEDAEMRVEESSSDLDAGNHSQAAADYQNKLQTFLSNGDRLQQVMFVRKGKMLILRAWNRFSQSFQDLIVRTILLNCLILIRRDVHDHALVRFLPLVNDVLVSLEDLQGLVSMTQLMDSAQKGNGYTSLTTTKMGVDLISLLMCRGLELMPKCSDQATRNQWSAFVSSVGDALLRTPIALKSDLGLLNLEPFQQVGMDDLNLKKLKTVLESLNIVGQEA